jgi:hypothetical protein
MPTARVNLSHSGYESEAIPVPLGATEAAVHVQAATWSTAVADLEWSLDPIGQITTADEYWATFDPAVQFSTSRKAEKGIEVGSVKFIRVRTTTAATADTDATVRFEFK